MALLSSVIASLLSVLVALSCVHLSTCHVVKGSVTCLDCAHDLSGVKVAVKCNQGKQLAIAFTDEKGFFQTDLPSSPSHSSSLSPNCLAMLLGGPKRLCSFKKNLVSKIVKAQDRDAYIISTPLTVFSTCSPTHSSHSSKVEDRRTEKTGGANMGFGSSKTVNLPLPREWGLAPSSYYFPFVPIIGIP